MHPALPSDAVCYHRSVDGTKTPESEKLKTPAIGGARALTGFCSIAGIK